MIVFPIPNLSVEENKMMARCMNELLLRRGRALMRHNFYNTKRQLDKVGFSIPPSMASLDAVLGWPTKAVDGLAGRLKLHGFVQTGKKGYNTDLEQIWTRSRMQVDWGQAQTATLIAGCSFIAVTPGDVDKGEPEVLIQPMPATECSGIWNVRTRRLEAAAWIPDCHHTYTSMAVLFLPDVTVVATRDNYGAGPWKVERIPNLLPRVPVTPLVHNGQLGRFFGESRLTRSAIYLCQMAARTLLRTEVGAEFYSSPQRYAMGAQAEDFEDENGNTVSAWDTILGKTWLISRDEDTGDLPQVGQFPQATMQPHTDMMRTITTLFAGETSLPVSSLGIIHDNPASAAAIDAAWADMVQLAEQRQPEFGAAAVEIAQNAMMTKNKQSSMPDELYLLRAKWQNAATPTLAAQTDAVTKQIISGMLVPDSEVGLEQAGYDETDIARIKLEHETAKADQAKQMAALGGPVNGAVGGPPANAAAQQALLEAKPPTDGAVAPRMGNNAGPSSTG